MTERERLIELLSVNMSEDCGVWDMADYLLDNGVAVLPCKAGSTIYSIRSDTKQIHECIIVRISFYECTNEIQYFINDDNRYSYCSFSDIGKTIFPTREEAEKALERSKK